MAFDPTKFYLGVNIGWLNEAYRHDLSYAFKNNWPPVFGSGNLNDFRDIINAYFLHLNRNNIKVVRMWLLEGLEGLTFSGPRFVPPFSATDIFNYANWTPPSPLADTFSSRVETIMTKAQQYGIQIYWTLLDAAALLPKNTPFDEHQQLFKHLLMKVTSSFNTNIVLPFLTSITPHQANVFAIDIINEVDWCWSKKANRLVRQPRAIAPFVKMIYDFIKQNSSFLVTVSFARFSELMEQFRRQPNFSFVDFFDYHRYFDPAHPGDRDDGELDNWTQSKACIIGEAGHNYDKFPPTNRLPRESLQASSTGTLMRNAGGRNYSGILLWRYSPVGDDGRLLRVVPSGTSSPSTAALNNFRTQFLAAAASAGPGHFAAFEGPVWNEISQFDSTIPSGKRP